MLCMSVYIISMHICAESFVVKKKRKPDTISQQESAEIIGAGIKQTAQLIKTVNTIQIQWIKDMELLSQGASCSSRSMEQVRMQTEHMKQCTEQLIKQHAEVQVNEKKSS